MSVALGRIRRFAVSLAEGASAVEVEPLRAGLEARAVWLVTARRADGGPPVRFVAKQLDGCLVREAAVYQELGERGVSWAAPRWLGTDRLPDGAILMFLDAVAGVPWPWRELTSTAEVVRVLARLHREVGPETRAVWADWYEPELLARARHASEALDGAPRRFLSQALLRTRPALRRLASDLPTIRAALAGFAPLAPTLVHGDVHSGNVMFQSSPEGPRVVLLDWGRARWGSPLEDVSSWIQSLGLWEPEARRRHDTLLGRYLGERGLDARLGADLRGAYWLAGACNVLSGAFAYHLDQALAAVAAGASASDAAAAWAPVQSWARVLRRADSFWR